MSDSDASEPVLTPPPPPDAEPPADAQGGGGGGGDASDDEHEPQQVEETVGEDDDFEAMVDHLHRRRLSNMKSQQHAPLYDSSDDEDFQLMSLAQDSPHLPGGVLGTLPARLKQKRFSASFSGSVDRQYAATKANRFGVQQERLIILDTHHRALRFLDTSMVVKSEFPFNEIARVEQLEGKSSKREEWLKLKISFKNESQRDYTLTFKSHNDIMDFLHVASVLLGENEFFENRARATTSRTTLGSLSGPLSETSLNLVREAKHVSGAAPDGGGDERGGAPAVVIAMPSGAFADDYLDYHVEKKNKYGRKQSRIIVLNTVLRTLLLLDDKRKSKKEIRINLITQVDIPKSTEDKSRAVVIFDPEADQRPFNLYFSDVFDRLHFCERLQTMNPGVVIKDESNVMVESDCLRFTVCKVTRVGVQRKRVIFLDSRKSVLRSVDVKRSVKEVDVSHGCLLRLEPDPVNRRFLTLRLRGRRHDWRFLFSDAAARERFIHRIRAMALPRPRAAPTTSSRGGGDAASPTTAHEAPAAFERSLSVGGEEPAPLSVFVGTYNVGESAFPFDQPMSHFIPPLKHDIYVVGLQECNKKEQWLKELHKHIMQSFEDDVEEEDQEYALLLVNNLQSIVMMIYVRRELLPRISNVTTDTVPCGLGDIYGNKGAVLVSMWVDSSSMCFVLCHLAARAERLSQRRDNYMKIVRAARVGHPEFDLLNQFHHLVWFGDLNYRIELGFQETIDLVEAEQWATLQAADQLNNEIKKHNCFPGFLEGELTFTPTYRWDRTSRVWSNKRNQPPSWTDRVLYRCLPHTAWEMQLQSYDGHGDVFGSDHRPVSATFSLKPRGSHMLGMQRACPQLEFVLSNLEVIALDEVELMPKLVYRVSSQLLEQDAESTEVVESQDGRWSWQNSLNVRPFMYDPDFIPRFHMFFTFLADAQNGDTFGQCVVSLSEFAQGRNHRCHAVITKAGVLIGQCSVDVVLRSTMKRRTVVSGTL